MTDEFLYEDGRKAEKIEIDEGKIKVTEVYVEPKVEKKLAQRITEKYCVCEREIETIDENTGEVISKIVEKVKEGEVVSLENSKSSIEKLIEEKLKNKKSISFSGLFLVALIVLQVVGLIYLLTR
jgi:hypothetical protein